MMKISKNMIIAVTITFCFIAAMFMVIPIRSQSSGQYDPWLDINDDGRISMDEIVATTTNFGTTGDPTRNVNVTNPTAMTIEEDLNMTIEWGGPGTPVAGWEATNMFATGGFNRMYICAALTECQMPNETLDINLIGVNWNWGSINGTYFSVPEFFISSTYINIHVDNSTYLPVSGMNFAEFGVKAAYCRLQFQGTGSTYPSSGWVIIHYSVYLINE